jgi:hypothetical protein
MSKEKDRFDEELEQEGAARELQQQIDQLISGHVSDEPPKSLREFISQEMLKEQRPRKTEKSVSDEQTDEP